MHGYKTIEDLSRFNNWTQSYRYKILKIEKNGQFYLFKRASDDFTKELLKNEIRWRKFFNRVDASQVANAEIVEVGEDFLLFRWVDAELLAAPDQESVAKFEGHLDRYVDLLLAVRKAARDYEPDADEARGIKPESRFNSPLAYHQRLKPLIDAGWIDGQKVNEVQKLYNFYLPFAEGGYQHGDFTPWHIFVQGNQWIIFDAEHATSLRSGYTDLLHSYARIACQGKNPRLASRLLGAFLDKSGEETDVLRKKIMAELVKKSVGSLIDSYNDRKTADFRRQANQLLDKVLKDDLQLLI